MIDRPIPPWDDAKQRQWRQALELLTDGVRAPRARKTLRQLSRQLEEGAGLDEAIASTEPLAPGPVRGILRAGRMSNDVVHLVEQFVQIQLTRRELRHSVWMAIAYPVVVVAFLAAVATGFLLGVVPMFADIYDDFGIAVPGPTRVTLWMSHTGIYGIGLLFLAAMIVLAGGWLLRRHWIVNRLRVGVPFLGLLWGWSSQMEFSRLLKVLVDFRIPLPDALDCTADCLADSGLGRACRQLRQRVAEGASLSESLGRSACFSRSLQSMAEWGQQSGTLSEAFQMAADMFEQRVRWRAEVLRLVLPPLVFLGVAAIISWLWGSTIYPMIDMIDALT